MFVNRKQELDFLERKWEEKVELFINKQNQHECLDFEVYTNRAYIFSSRIMMS